MLKVFNGKNKAAFRRELATLEAIREDPEVRDCFPKIYSAREGPESAELLLEAMGPDVRYL